MIDLDQLDTRGFLRVPELFDASTCSRWFEAFDDEAWFRKTVIMEHHRFGRGRYRYFADPLPEDLVELRRALYAELAPLARAWWERLGFSDLFSDDYDRFAARNTLAGQSLPTPLLLDYRAGDYNCLHQDRYGKVWFPFQVAVQLSEPGEDFEGGEFVLVENRPRAQSAACVVPLRRGDAVVFPCDLVPRAGVRGWYRVKVRHGVSEVRSGVRRTLGIIFHGASR